MRGYRVLFRAVCVFRFRSPGVLLVAAVLLTLFFPSQSRAWGDNANKLIVNRAIETLPQDVRPFFEGSRGFLLQHVNDPLASAVKTPTERRTQYLVLEKYGRFPFEARLYAAILANYVAAAHDPFNTTDNNDGKLTGQLGVNDRFGTTLIDRYSSFFPMRPNDAMFISDPTDYAFEACLRSHSWLETILFADRNSRRGLNSYTDEYYDRFYNQAAAILIRQLSDASTDVGSFWLTAWKNAGQPQLPR